jgi:phage-related protein
VTLVDVEPVLDFLKSLDTRLRAKVYRGIDLLANHWPYIGEPHVRHVSGCEGLWELRERLGNTRVRLFFFQAKPGVLVIVHGYIKKTKKAPPRILETAVRKMREYQSRGDL